MIRLIFKTNDFLFFFKDVGQWLGNFIKQKTQNTNY